MPALVFALLFGTVVPAAAQSSDTTGIIQITVRSASGDAPLADARVFLLGPTVASALTNKSGIVKYTDVPSGLYRVRVGKSGYAGVMSAQFEVLGEKQVDVRVSLATVPPRNGQAVAGQGTPPPSTAANTSGLKIIGTVKARVTVTTTDVDQNSAVRRISDSLLDALGTIGGVDVTQSSNDPDAPQTISLRGHDESQTAITLDGIPLGAPGSAVNLRGINTDLFTGAGVSFGAQAGALGGSVNFRTLQPTLTWQSMFSGSYGTFDKYNYQLGETGSIGKLGIAVLATKRAGNSPLTFQDFEDESGLTYPHGGESANIGDYVKLRYSLTDRTTLMFTALQNNQATSSLCTTDVTPFPCGIGPGNGSTGRFQFAYGTVQTLIGDTAVTATTYVNSTRNMTNDLARYQLGCPGEALGSPPDCGASSEVPISNPFATQTSTLARGIAASATTTRDKHTITLSGSTYASTTAFTPLVGGLGFVTPGVNAVASRQVQLSDTIKANDKLSLGPNVSYAGTTGAGESLLAGFSASWRPENSDTYNGSVSVGSSQPAAGIIRSFSDPTSARVNCIAQTAQVSGPGDQPGKQFADSYDLGWTHQWAHGQFSLDTYRQIQGDQLINATLTADSLGLTDPSNPFYNAYYQAIVGYYGDECPGSAPPNVFVSEAIGGTTRMYQGFTATANIGLGKNVVVIPSYSTTGASVIAADPRYLGYDSTLILGAQLPGRPVHTGNLTIDALYAPAQLEFLANAHYVGANNNQYIAPYVTVNAGISHPLGMGRITLFAANLFDTETAPFSTEQYAVPVPLSGGGVLLQAARPNPPRSYTVTYSFNTGARPGAGFARGMRAAQTAAAAASPPPRGFLGFGQLKFIAPPPGVDPLTVASTRPECTPDLMTEAQTVLAQLGAAAKAYAAGQPLPAVKGISVTPHGAATESWYFGLGPDIPESALPQRPAGEQGPGGRRGGFGGPRGERGPGGPGGPPGGFQPEINVQSEARPNEPRPQFSPSPQLVAALVPFRALVSCSYGTVLTPGEAKAQGYDVPAPGVRPSPTPSPAPGATPAPRRGRFGGNFIDYAPKIGIFVVRAPELGTGGGSVKQ
ncbi:MAG TPA: TonB-dependent receptor [Candidatus Baltobacteraceae bacterium]|nr:TonB-dependent receptor [Candidatus Baltobacteraceae bacterium]